MRGAMRKTHKGRIHMGISAKELAQKIHVSPSTISMVFNNRPGISESTRKLVLDAAKEYDYIAARQAAPEKKAIQLAIYQKHALVVSDTPFFSQVIEGIIQGGNERGCAVNVTYLKEAPNQKFSGQEISSMAGDGMILLATEMGLEDFESFQGMDMPMIVLDCYYEELDYDCVVINNSQGAYCATEHLVAMGHKRIGYLHSSVNISNFEERRVGFMKALNVHGLPAAPQYVHRLSSTSAQGYQDMVQILKGKPELADAYIADNDIIAAAAMKAFQEFGYRIPQDVSIVGFDDMPLCDIMNPPLSTIRVDKKELGATAVECLLARMEERKRGPRKISLKTCLVRRESVLDLRGG